MKKQSIRVISLLISLMLVMTNVVWAMPGEGVTPNKTYDGNADLPWTASNDDSGVSWAKATDYLNKAYYKVSGTAKFDLKSGVGPYIGIPTGSSPNMYETDFMFGNETTGLALRLRTSTDSKANGAFGVFSDWKVGATVGNTVFEANKWYRMAVVFTAGTEENKMSYDIYLDGERVLGGVNIDGNKPNFVRIYFVVKNEKDANISFDNIYAYKSSEAYNAGTANKITAVAEEVGVMNEAGNAIKVKAGVTAKQLKNSITTDGDEETKVLIYKNINTGVEDNDEIRTGQTLVVRSGDKRFTYYTLQDSYYANYDFDNETPSVYLENGEFSVVNDEERNSQVLEIISANNGSSTGFAVKNLEFNEPYIISYDVKREGNSTVSQSWNGAANRIISIYTNSVQLFCKNAMSTGTKYGEWTRYAAYVDPIEKKAQLYINGEAVGEEMDLSETTTSIVPVVAYPSFRFFVQSTDTKVWVDDFAIYSATAEDAAKLTESAIEVAANEESDISVVGVPGAMGKISGAAGTDVANIGTILTAGEGVAINIYTAEGTPVTEGAIADGMILKASKGGITALYRFADANVTLISQEKTEGKINLVMDSYDNNLVIFAKYAENENILLDMTVSYVSKGYYTKEVTYEAGEKVKVFVWDDAQSLMPLYVFE